MIEDVYNGLRINTSDVVVIENVSIIDFNRCGLLVYQADRARISHVLVQSDSFDKHIHHALTIDRVERGRIIGIETDLPVQVYDVPLRLEDLEISVNGTVHYTLDVELRVDGATFGVDCDWTFVEVRTYDNLRLSGIPRSDSTQHTT